MSRDGAPRAAATLCGLYHEAGQQLRRLQDQLAARDALIARLRARLAALEGHAAPSLVDALLEQVARFREQLRRREGGAREAGLRQEIERLTERLEEREQEVQRLLSQPQHAGAREAVLLRTSLEKKERAQATSRVLCHSLAAETHQLRRTLAATTHMCQHLAARLDEQQPSQGEPECAGEDTSRQSVIDKLQEENRLLKQKVIHVEDLNAKWQRYDASRDEYVRGLQAPPGPGLLRKEISRLNTQLAETGKACSHLQQERAAALERVQMLEQQILAYKEDFESERADRERAHCRIQELEEKVSSLLYQVSQTEDSREPGPRRIPPPSNTAKFVETEALGSAAPAGRGPGPGSQRPEPPAEGRDPSTGRRGQGRLQCPRCLRFFGEDQGEELLRHTSLCCQ